MATKDIDYHDGELALRGFLAYDETSGGKRPGILVAHEAWGLGEHAMDKTRTLADMGYIAFAADLFGNRKQITDIAEAGAIIGDLRQDPMKLRNRALAALRVLATLPQVDSTRLGAIGFCFGGTAVLELARGGADIRGVVCFHGSLDTSSPASPGRIKSSVLVCTGSNDPMIPPSQLNAFTDEMRNAEVDWQMTIYGSTVHSFTNPAADGSISPGILYNKKSDERSWRAMRSFFEDRFAQ
jgi:dienelactone hydrolase